MTGAEAEAIMARHARSFAPATRILARADRSRVAQLYALCRFIDDLADEDGSETAAARLAEISRALRHGGSAGHDADPIVDRASALFAGRPCGLNAFAMLVDGVRGDIGEVRIADHAALDAYTHAVAGTVGIMISDLFDVEKRFHGAAADLGKAMQLTNICRDVAEDARAGRRYLPAALCRWQPADIADPTPRIRADIRAAVATLLHRAEYLYASGRTGLGALPLRLRLAVAASSAIYRGIGAQLRERDCDPLTGRVFVTGPRKLRLACGAVLALAWQGAAGTGSLRAGDVHA